MPETFETPKKGHRQEMAEVAARYPEYFAAVSHYMLDGPKEESGREAIQAWKSEQEPILRAMEAELGVTASEMNLIFKKVIVDRDGHM